MAAIVRVGIGTDLHRLEAGRRLILGGVAIPFDSGLAGHSDGDIVLHAIADAILGAAGLPDIGEQFPDTDPRYSGADSRGLLAEVIRKVLAAGYLPGNIDVTIHAERPRLSAHKSAIAASIASLLDISPDVVSVKAKTNEGLDAIGRGEAMGCTAIVGLLSRS